MTKSKKETKQKQSSVNEIEKVVDEHLEELNKNLQDAIKERDEYISQLNVHNFELCMESNNEELTIDQQEDIVQKIINDPEIIKRQCRVTDIRDEIEQYIKSKETSNIKMEENMNNGTNVNSSQNETKEIVKEKKLKKKSKCLKYAMIGLAAVATIGFGLVFGKVIPIHKSFK